MRLKDICNLLDNEDTPVKLYGKCGWICTFPACYVPSSYADYCISRINPEKINSDIELIGLVVYTDEV